jgi:hypothetical protein
LGRHTSWGLVPVRLRCLLSFPTARWEAMSARQCMRVVFLHLLQLLLPLYVIGEWQVLRPEFYNRLVLEHVASACQVLVHLCFMNPQLSVTVCTSLRNCVVAATQHTVSVDMKPFFKAMTVRFLGVWGPLVAGVCVCVFFFWGGGMDWRSQPR